MILLFGFRIAVFVLRNKKVCGPTYYRSLQHDLCQKLASSTLLTSSSFNTTLHVREPISRYQSRVPTISHFIVD